MNINHQLLQPLIERIEGEYNDLLEEIKPYESLEVQKLRDFISKKLRQLQMVRVSLSYMSSDEAQKEETQGNLRDTLRQQKLELRFARRRWKRHSANKDLASEPLSEAGQEVFAA